MKTRFEIKVKFVYVYSEVQRRLMRISSAEAGPLQDGVPPPLSFVREVDAPILRGVHVRPPLCDSHASAQADIVASPFITFEPDGLLQRFHLPDVYRSFAREGVESVDLAGQREVETVRRVLKEAGFREETP